MRFKKSACALLLGGSLSVLNIGCAAVDALVSSPAGHSANGGSPQRLAAIGRVFENQGRYTQARAMYRQALRSDPGNTTARDRLQYLASLNSSTNRRTPAEEAFAIADVVAPPKSPRPQRTHVTRPVLQERQDAIEPSIQMVRAFESSGEVRAAALTVGGQLESAPIEETPADATQSAEADVVEWELDAEAADIEINSSSDSVGRVVFSSDSKADGESVTDEIGVVSRQAASERFEIEVCDQPVVDSTMVTPECTELELFPETEHSAEVGLWRPARASVSLSEVLHWSDVPDAHDQQLIDATRRGADQGVKALAVALLGEISQPSNEVVTALKQSALSQIPMVRVAALDALVIQGEADSETIDGLLELLTGDDAGIQAKAAATLIRTADTEWQGDAISGLHQLLKDGNDSVVAVAATSLSEFGTAAIPCREQLTAVAAATSSELVLEATSMALSRIPRAEY